MVRQEGDGVAIVRSVVAPRSIIHADEAGSWESLHAYFKVKRINHSEAYSRDGVSTNQAESFFSRMRRAEFGQHHRISGKYLFAYAREMAWREDTRRQPNGSGSGMAAWAPRGG